MTRLLIATLVLLVYALHQDFWFWSSARPMLLGFLPIGLAYHGLYSVALALLFWLLVRYCWPSQPQP